MDTLSSFYSKETIKEAKKIDIRPEMLEVGACIACAMLGIQHRNPPSKDTFKEQIAHSPIAYVYYFDSLEWKPRY